MLTFRREPIVALYSASCGGRTRSLTEAGFRATDGYPYFNVECPYCSRHARDWERVLGADPSEQRLASERSEGARLAVGRRKGWSAVPGSNFDVTEDDDALVLRGRGLGHGVGLCQAGASGLAAERHATFAEILAWYYPGTVLEVRQQRSRR